MCPVFFWTILWNAGLPYCERKPNARESVQEDDVSRSHRSIQNHIWMILLTISTDGAKSSKCLFLVDVR